MILRGFVVISHSKHNDLQETSRGGITGLMMMMMMAAINTKRQVTMVGMTLARVKMRSIVGDPYHILQGEV